MADTGLLSGGTILQGRYIIHGSIGKGGMGHVYRAKDSRRMGRWVAVKEMSQQNMPTDRLAEAQQRFRQEAEILSKLSHANLPCVYGSFSEGGHHYLVMDFIEGKTLTQLVDGSASRQLPAMDMLQYALQLCSVLSYLHKQQPQPIIFRDLKPDNVMVTTDGRVFLIDFGIARFFQPGKRFDTVYFGSKGFCPPEQYGTEQTSPRSDLYGLGATLHYCLTGRHPLQNTPNPFNFRSVRLYHQQVPVNLDTLILQLVAINEKDRPASAELVRQRLEKIIDEARTTTVSMNSVSHTKGRYYNPTLTNNMQVQGQPQPSQGSPAAVGAGRGTTLPAQRVAEPLRDAIRQLQLSPFSVALSLLTVLGSIAMLTWLHSPPQVVLSLLALILLMIAFLTSLRRHIDDYTRNKLVPLVLAASLLCLSLATQQNIQSWLNTLSLSSVFSILFITLSSLSLMRPARVSPWLERLLVIAIASVCVLIQLHISGHELPPLPWARMMGLDAYSAVVLLLAVIACLALVSLLRPFSRWDRILIAFMALVSVWQQWLLGKQELLVLFQYASPTSRELLTINVINWLLILAPPFLCVLSLRYPAESRIARMPVLLLAIVSGTLQQVLAPSILLPATSAGQSYSLSARFLDVLSLDQIVFGGFLLLAAILLITLFKRTGRSLLDYIAIFTLAAGCIGLQLAAWHQYNTLEKEPLNVLLVLLLCLALCCTLLCTIVSIMLAAARKGVASPTGDWATCVGKLAAGMGHIMIVLSVVICLLLQWSFGRHEPFHAVFPIRLTDYGVAKQTIVLWQEIFVLQVIIGIIAFATFCHFCWSRKPFDNARPFGIVAPFTALTNMLVCTLFLAGDNPVLSLLFLQQGLSVNAPTMPTALALFTPLALLLTVVVSLFWLRNVATPFMLRTLQIILGLALICALAQFIWPLFAIIALVVLIQGLLLVVGKI